MIDVRPVGKLFKTCWQSHNKDDEGLYLFRGKMFIVGTTGKDFVCDGLVYV